MSKDNLRARERRELQQQINVFDTVSQRSLGRLVNIHREGLMLLVEAPIQVDALYQIVIQLPQPLDGRSELPLGVDCLWLKELDESGNFWAGFQIIDISAQDMDVVDSLL